MPSHNLIHARNGLQCGDLPRIRLHAPFDLRLQGLHLLTQELIMPVVRLEQHAMKLVEASLQRFLYLLLLLPQPSAHFPTQQLRRILSCDHSLDDTAPRYAQQITGYGRKLATGSLEQIANLIVHLAALLQQTETMA